MVVISVVNLFSYSVLTIFASKEFFFKLSVRACDDGEAQLYKICIKFLKFKESKINIYTHTHTRTQHTNEM